MATARPVKFSVKVDLAKHRAATRMLSYKLGLSVKEILPYQVASLCVSTANAIKPDEIPDIYRIMRTKALWRLRINGKAREHKDSTAINIGMKGQYGRAWRTVHRGTGDPPIHIPYHLGNFQPQTRWTTGKTTGKPLPENFRSEHNAKVSAYGALMANMERNVDSARYFTKRSFIDIAKEIGRQGGFTLDQIKPKIRVKDRSKVEKATTIMGETRVNGDAFINQTQGKFYVRISNHFPTWKERRLDAEFGKQIRRQANAIKRQTENDTFKYLRTVTKAYPWIKARQT